MEVNINLSKYTHWTFIPVSKRVYCIRGKVCNR